MKKIILIVSILSLSLFAEFSDKEAKELAIKASKIRQELKLDKPPLSEKEKKIIAIRKELNLPVGEILVESENSNIATETMKRTILPDETTSVTDSISSVFSSLEESLTSSKTDESFSLVESFGLKEGEYWGLPSLFGLNKKQKHSEFGLSTFTDIKSLGDTVYKGFKHSGQSAEFMSGVMYYNAKMYNTMFGMFDDSPFNIFEDEDETSILDVFEKGNNLLDIFD